MTWWFALLAAPFVGSFLFVLIRRLPARRPVLWGRSRCESCGHRLGPVELVPIVSFLAQRAR
ncbi:MAG: prepilin peptidase, partial [Promicromonosporaceae bacterium]|nr:prepilin peptidase [Promicromonosporaceae bacterium]